jgi:hypothetical protein
VATLDVGAAIGLEKIGRQMLLQLYNGLNAEITATNTLWLARDTTFATETGLVVPPVTLEAVANENFHHGHIPSLIEAPIEKYPNIAVLASSARPLGPEAGIDQGYEYTVTAYVETMIKSLVSQEETNARALRMIEAIHTVLMRDPTLDGLVTNVDLVSVDITDVFIRREAKSRGTEWWWQGGRLDYNVRKPASYQGFYGG